MRRDHAARRNIAAIFLFASMGHSAMAADWSGFYAALGIGVNQARLDPDSAILIVDDFGTRTEVPGAQSSEFTFIAGLMTDFGTTVLGFEAEASLSPGAELGLGPGPVELGFVVECPAGTNCLRLRTSGEIDGAFRFRALAGTEIGDWLIFGAGGVAFAHVTYSGIDLSFSLSSSSNLVAANGPEDPISEFAIGPSIGGGAQLRLSEHVALRIEALIDFLRPINYVQSPVRVDISPIFLSMDPFFQVLPSNRTARAALIVGF